ncbi:MULTISPECIES: ATP-dependent nuclease [Pseudoalteromonas]|uniref:ATP-dependent nuclease n=1 Tax=Pseudoalteromonas TaxID=53246 RepID=UPI000781D6F4|nr:MULTISPECIES: ATP-dependent endonuclease [Pseudoalteromonas]MCH2089315.1 ATP-dependent endonuclease [Pseudoalteromonas sp.]HCV02591.1 ATP-dependent endonuclease [Pseudoalteromonas sp.]|tara:strand:+ start:449 stop:2410 length:1962 start_codon:yes stop_codon:yes gene_type:complete
MKLESVRIQNFRSFKDETINFDNYNCFVGPNGAGKSTVMNALNVFFRQHKDSKTDLSKLSVDDFHHKNTNDPISITVTFKELSEDAKRGLADYVRQDKLVVTAKAEYDEGTERAEVKQFGNRLGMTEFKIWFEAEKAKKPAKELKEIFARLRSQWPEISTANTKADMAVALNSFEAAHPESCSLIPSEDQFYGVTKGANRLAPHLQWVFVSASKDFSEEAEENKNSALGQLLSRAIRSKVNFTEKVTGLRNDLKQNYQSMLEAEQGVLSSISDSLETKLKLWANPSATAKVLWKSDAEKAIKIEEPFAHIQIGEKGFESELARFGHGMQRSYLLTLLQELAAIDDENAPTLVMAIEEPELYQHPPQARYLSEVLQELANDNSQIVVCSHSPYFIPSDDFHAVRMVREVGSPISSSVTSLKYDDLVKELSDAGEKAVKESGMIAKLYPTLRPEISEMFFSKKLILVEGVEDVAYLTSYIQLMEKLSEFRRSGYHIIPVGGKNELIKPLAIAKLLNIEVFVICDADTDKTRESEINKHKKDNAAILHLLGHEKGENWPSNDVIKTNLRMWKTNITNTIGPEFGKDWNQHEDQAAAFYGNAGGLKKNPLAVSRALESAWKAGLKSDTLQDLVNNILGPTEPEANKSKQSDSAGAAV